MINKLIYNTKKYPFPICLYRIWDKIWQYILIIVCTARVKFWLRMNGCSFGSNLSIIGRPIFRAFRKGSIKIGSQVTLISSHRVNLVGLTTPVILEVLGSGSIEIGDRSGGSGIVISSRNRVVIGSHVKLGGNVRIYDHDYHSLNHVYRRNSKTDSIHVKTSPVIVENDVFVGANAMILKGVHIGEYAIIGAGSVVSKNVPAGEVWAGNPARFIGLTAKVDTK